MTLIADVDISEMSIVYCCIGMSSFAVGYDRASVKFAADIGVMTSEVFNGRFKPLELGDNWLVSPQDNVGSMKFDSMFAVCGSGEPRMKSWLLTVLMLATIEFKLGFLEYFFLGGLRSSEDRYTHRTSESE